MLERLCCVSFFLIGIYSLFSLKSTLKFRVFQLPQTIAVFPGNIKCLYILSVKYMIHLIKNSICLPLTKFLI